MSQDEENLSIKLINKSCKQKAADDILEKKTKLIRWALIEEFAGIANNKKYLSSKEKHLTGSFSGAVNQHLLKN